MNRKRLLTGKQLIEKKLNNINDKLEKLRLQELAGITEDDMEGDDEDEDGGTGEYPTPNLDIRDAGLDEYEFQDFTEKYIKYIDEVYEDLGGIESVEEIEESLGKELPVVYTFVIQGDYSDSDEVRDMGDGNYIYVNGGDGTVVGVLVKNKFNMLVQKLKKMGAKPHTA